MTVYSLPYFGEIEINSLKDYYCVTAQIGGRSVEVDISFTQNTSDEPSMDAIKHFLEQIEWMDKENVKYYTMDFNKEGEVADYIEFYLDELFEEELEALVNRKQPLKNQKEELLNKLELVRVGLYPNDVSGTESFGVFDYSIKIGDEYCEQLLVVNTKEDGKPSEISWES